MLLPLEKVKTREHTFLLTLALFYFSCYTDDTRRLWEELFIWYILLDSFPVAGMMCRFC